MQIRYAAHCLGIAALLGFGCPQSRATGIVLFNDGGTSNYAYHQTYNTTQGYIVSTNGGATTTVTSTAPGLLSNQIGGSAIEPNGNVGRLAFADSTVSASIATGEIKIFSESGPCYNTPSFFPGCGNIGGSNTSGGIIEGVTFHNTTGHSVVVSYLFRATLDATIQCVPNVNCSSVGGITQFVAGGGKLTYNFANCGLVNCGFIDGSRTSGFDSIVMSPSGTFGEQFIATKTLAAGDTSQQIFETFNPVCSAGATCDGTHTAALTINLPTGVTFTSDSGIFLTQSPGAAPEPGTWVMLASAGLLFGISRLRSRSQRR